jgi:hypothetical protein
MEAKILHSPNGYGFGHDWQLQLTKDQVPKTFYLGQDAKVCSRILGMNATEMEREGLIPNRNIDDPETNKALAWLIVRAVTTDPEAVSDEYLIEVAEHIYDHANAWDIAAE